MVRKIIHIDMDAFYAAIEQRDSEQLRGKPIIVGGDPNSRGVVATASYEARKFGIHSAMPSIQAYRRCPTAIFIKPRFDVYKQVSNQMHAIFKQYTDLIEPLALDEAYLDVTCNKLGESSATLLAKKILKQIHSEIELTASAGVSFNKFLAKLASGWKKPSGLTVITPDEAQKFIDELPIGKFYGVGKATEKKMLKLGIVKGSDLKDYPLEELCRHFGKMGLFFHQLANGHDNRAVNPSRQRKSLGKETTFEKDIIEFDELKNVLRSLAEEVVFDLSMRHLHGRTVTVKVRYSNFKTITRSKTRLEPFTTLPDIIKFAEELLATTLGELLAVRLLGISISGFDDSKPMQLFLFD